MGIKEGKNLGSIIISPSLMMATAVGMFLTILTDGPIAIAAGLLMWFLNLMNFIENNLPVIINIKYNSRRQWNMKPTPLYKKDYKVEINQVDFKGKIKLSSLFTYFQDVAGLHAENLGMGRKVLYEQHGVIWVLVRIRVDIIKYPKWKDIITVETWPQEPSRMGFDRDFLVKDNEGNIMAKAVSTWVVIDVESRKLMKTKSVYTGYPPIIEKRAIDCKLGSLNSKGQLEMSYKRTVRYSDIDINGHLNNVKYLDFIMDSFSLEEHRSLNVKSIEISYSNESLPGDTITIYKDTSRIHSNIIYMEGINQKDNLVFKSKMEI